MKWRDASFEKYVTAFRNQEIVAKPNFRERVFYSSSGLTASNDLSAFKQPNDTGR